jgi:uncharacterized membrane protein YeiB
MTDQVEDSTQSLKVDSSAGPALAPIAESKRIAAMDILRGFALIGILLMNIEWFGRSILELGTFDESLTGFDHAVGWLIRCFVEGKFYKLFALLFGMGFAVMLLRARESGKPFGAWFTRRMLVLFVIGMLHMVFLWGGDILHDYAIAGLVFLGFILLLGKKRFRKYDNPKSYLKIALIWLSLPIAIGAIAGLGFGPYFSHEDLTNRWEQEKQVVSLVAIKMEEAADIEANDAQLTEDDPGEEEQAEPTTDAASDTDSDTDADTDTDTEQEEQELSEEEELQLRVEELFEQKLEIEGDKEEELEALTHGSYWEATRYRFFHALSALKLTPALTFMMLLPIFLLGFWFVSSGVIRDHHNNAHIFRPMAIIGLSLGLVFTVSGLLVIQQPVVEQSLLLMATGQILFYMGQFVLCAGYLGTLITLLRSPKWAQRLNVLAPMGRMALTNYIAHSVILTSLFYGYAGGLYGQVSRAPQMLIVVAIIVLQAFYSDWWLKRFRFGPLEWLWRSMTYMSLQPMKVRVDD